jgi:hypothetical protein
VVDSGKEPRFRSIEDIEIAYRGFACYRVRIDNVKKRYTYNNKPLKFIFFRGSLELI